MSPTAEMWIMLGFFVAFAVKLPVVVLHTWLPDAHTEAPTAGSVILGGPAVEDRRLRNAAVRGAALPLMPPTRSLPLRWR